ncbi:Yae1 family protein [Alicyclobacillus acidocaldarius]|nr:Yae1 family protein [Alicyclobacillus acidocaldarius]
MYRLIDEIFEDGRREGHLEGFKEGLQEGIEKGMEKGMEKGIEMGTEMGVRRVARNMLEAGMPCEVIERATGLSRDAIEALRKQMN